MDHRADKLAGPVAEYLRSERERGEACVHAPELARRFAVTDRTIRAAVEAARRRGFLIGSGPDGFFYAVSEEEMEPVMENLKRRARSIFRTRAAIKRELRRRRGGAVQLELLPAAEPVRRSA